MHIQSPIRENLSKFSQLSFCQKLFFLNQPPSCICSKYQIVPSKAVVTKELIGPCMAYNSISIKPYIESHLELQREITLIELAPSP